MFGADADRVTDAPNDVAGEPAVVQKGDVLLPWQPDHHAQSGLRGLIEQPMRRRRVHPDSVHAMLGHLREVGFDDMRVMVLAAGERPGFLRTEGAVSDSPNVQFFGFGDEELPAHGRPGNAAPTASLADILWIGAASFRFG